MDRIERIGPRPSHWARLELDPDREDIAERRRREEERRRREARERAASPDAPPSPEDDPPHHIDIRA